MKVLVTGGAGYIGTHTTVELLAEGHEVVVIDNYSNSCQSALKRVVQITGKEFPFYEVDIRDKERLEAICSLHKFDCCMHFAGSISPAHHFQR